MKAIKFKAAFLAAGIFSATAIFAQDSSHMPKRDTTKMPKSDSTSMIYKKKSILNSKTNFSDTVLVYSDKKAAAKQEKPSKKIG